MAAATELCQQKGRGVRGLKSTTAAEAASTSSRKPGICWRNETKVTPFCTTMVQLFPNLPIF